MLIKKLIESEEEWNKFYLEYIRNHDYDEYEGSDDEIGRILPFYEPVRYPVIIVGYSGATEDCNNEFRFTLVYLNNFFENEDSKRIY